MRIGKINWELNGAMPIQTVDAQPGGFRFVTGGTDNLVCIWNLLPVISAQYENSKSNMNGREGEEGKIID